jgi:hypothetical protein
MLWWHDFLLCPAHARPERLPLWIRLYVVSCLPALHVTCMTVYLE